MEIYVRRNILTGEAGLQEAFIQKVLDTVIEYMATTDTMGKYYQFFYIKDGIDVSSFKLKDPKVVSRTYWEF